MKVLTVVGARPQFIKAAPTGKALRAAGHQDFLVHTGQHYDDAMSEVFFRELEIPRPDVNLEIGSGSHGLQTGKMLMGLEEVIQQEKPHWVLVYGDTNSTLAAALAACKLQVPLAHVEAGLRSFNRAMPEEHNRVLTDHCSDLLLCPTQAAVDNLATENIKAGVHLVGDVMADAFAFAGERAHRVSRVIEQLGLAEKNYLLATVHRAENTNDLNRLKGILGAFDQVEDTIVFPVHPRTRKILQDIQYAPAPNVRLIDPVPYLDMVRLQQAARLIVTDSGGVQKEAYWASVPCITLRDETEWVETVQSGWNTLVGAGQQQIVEAIQTFQAPADHPSLYGDGNAAQRCVTLLESTTS
ncbi:MAG TPA: UDP-N-acetylglucosamine 2-epimerase (non-hydrolyzing) [Abditibacteriaceae bacterium]|jgi:UDP-N-acetylglucosamine 2-epimerase